MELAGADVAFGTSLERWGGNSQDEPVQCIAAATEREASDYVGNRMEVLAAGARICKSRSVVSTDALRRVITGVNGKRFS